jgi:hypothetical protein
MKNLIIATALLISSLSAQATSLHPDTFAQVSKLTKLDLAPEIFGTPKSVTVKLNTVVNTITLEAKYAQPCPPPRLGMVSCMAVGREDLRIELPIVSKKIGGCGQTIYVAKKDKRPVDGNLNAIQLVDNRTMTCRIALRPDQMTIVSHKMVTSGMGGQVETFKSQASGPALKSPFASLPQ